MMVRTFYILLAVFLGVMPLIDSGTTVVLATGIVPRKIVSIHKPIETTFLSHLSSLPTTESEPRTLIISNVNDSGPGSLRQALSEAQSGDTISFDPASFSPTTPAVIQPIEPLPAVHQSNITLDASQSYVVLDGSHITDKTADGLEISGSYNRVMGLQIVSFSGNGIKLHGGAQHNQIGGDPQIGSAPTGQGNLISGNLNHGIALLNSGTSHNIISGNRIGTDVTGNQPWGNRANGIELNGASHNLIENNLLSGNSVGGVDLCCTDETHANVIRGNRIGTNWGGDAALPNQAMGVYIQHGAAGNIVGPDNMIAHNGSSGIEVWGSRSPNNTITQNSIHDNLGNGITLWNENFDLVQVAIITSFDFESGTVSGLACPDCVVEIFSDQNNEGEVFEGKTHADAGGVFSFSKGTAFSGPHVTTTVTDANGATSMFSTPAVGSRLPELQTNNSNPVARFIPKTSSELADNRVSAYVPGPWVTKYGLMDAYVMGRLGVKRAHISMNDPDSYQVIWSEPETLIHSNFDEFVTGLKAQGIEPTYNLIFWDKEAHGGSAPDPTPRFKTEEEVARYLDFVRLIVQSFGDRVDYYEIFDEPSFANSYQWVEVEDYIQLAKRAISVIRKEDPGAKSVVGSFHGWDDDYYKQYLYHILQSDLMPLVDVISWHPYISVLTQPECGQDFYNRYPQILEEIKALATANGFKGEFRADELIWLPAELQPDSPCFCNDRACAKYYMRGIVFHLAQNVSVGFVLSEPASMRAIQNLNTLMAGAQSTTLEVQVDSAAAHLKIFSFARPEEEKLIAIWSDGPVMDEDPTWPATVTLTGLSSAQASAIDLLNGYEQALTSRVGGDNLIIENFLLRDYPLFIRLR